MEIQIDTRLRSDIITAKKGGELHMPVIYSTPELGPDEGRVIRQIENIKSRIKAATGTDGATNRWLGPLRRDLAARHIQGSNSIEGILLSMEEAAALVADEEPLDEKTKAWLDAEGYKRAMTYVLQLAKDEDFTYSANLIKSLHFMMLEHEMDKRPGRWRKGAIFVTRDHTNEVVYEGPDVEVVPELVEELISELNTDADTTGIVKAAMAHLNLVMIHPFKDGNGRMARCLQSLVLARSGTLSPVFLSIEEYLGLFTLDYYKILGDTALGVWNPTRDALPWVRFCLAAHFFQGSLVATRIKIVHRGWQEIEAAVLEFGLPDRCISPLIDAFLGRNLRNQPYRMEADVSDQVATNDLGRLVKYDFLEPRGERRGRYYVAGRRLIEIREKVYFKPQIPHPFRRPDEAEAFSLEGLRRDEQPEQTSLFDQKELVP